MFYSIVFIKIVDKFTIKDTVLYLRALKGHFYTIFFLPLNGSEYINIRDNKHQDECSSYYYYFFLFTIEGKKKSFTALFIRVFIHARYIFKRFTEMD